MPAGQYKVQLPWRLLQSQRALIVPVTEVRTWKAQHRGGVAACPQAGEHQGGRGGLQQGSALGEESRQCWSSWQERGERSSVGTRGVLTALLDGLWPPPFPQLRVLAPWAKGGWWRLGWHWLPRQPTGTQLVGFAG